MASKTLHVITFLFFYVLLRFSNPKKCDFLRFLLCCIRFLEQWVLLYIVPFIELFDVEYSWPWNLGHWRSFKLLPFQSVTSHKPSEIVLSLVCSGTVQVWWMMNAKSVADHSRHVVRRLQSSVIHTKTHYSAPAGSSRLCMLHFGEG